jgi:cyclin C
LDIQSTYRFKDWEALLSMAANYWASTQRRHWLFSRETLADIRERLREKDKITHSQFPLPDQRLLNIYFNQRKS